jgi:integrase
MFSDYTAPQPAPTQPHPIPEGIDGIKRLIRACGRNEKHRVLIALCGLIGCRVAEALSIGPKDFDLHAMTLKIRGKGDKERVVPVSSAAWEVLQIPVTRAILDNKDRLLDFNDRYARRVVTELGQKAGLQRHISSHDLRATFATAVYDNTLDQRVTQILLGHANGKTTEGYIGRSQEQMKGAVEW